MDRGAWWTTVPRHAKSWTWPMWLSIHSENVLHALEKFSGQKTGVGSHSLPQGIFQTERLNPGLLHCRWILYQLSHQGSPRVHEWVAIPSSADLPDPGIELGSPAVQADSLLAELPEKSKECVCCCFWMKCSVCIPIKSLRCNVLLKACVPLLILCMICPLL